MVHCSFLFLLACCNRGSLGCQIHVLVESILSIIAAAVLLYFNNLFLNNPYTCLFGTSSECSLASYSSTYGIYSTTGYTVKLACIKAELGCAAVMLTTCVVYILVFIVVTLRVGKTDNNDSGNQPRVFPVQYVAPVPVIDPRPALPTIVFGPIPSKDKFSMTSTDFKALTLL